MNKLFLSTKLMRQMSTSVLLPKCISNTLRFQYQFHIKEFWGENPSKFLLFVKSTIDVLSALTFSLILSHQFCTQLNALCIKSQMVMRYFPLMRITTPSAKPCTKQLQFSNRFSRLSATIFQSKGDSTPPVDNHVAHSYALS
jgi:hypothetical protein